LGRGHHLSHRFGLGGKSPTVSDIDQGASVGLAVVAANETQGMWWYSLNGGGEWWRLGSVSPASIRLLPASAMLVFRPDRNFVG